MIKANNTIRKGILEPDFLVSLKSLLMRLCVCVLFFSALPFSSLAQAGTSADFGDGSVIIGTDGTACSGSIEGAIRYNSANKCTEFCNGTKWTCPGGAACVAPSGCTSIGDTCADGSIFGGYLLRNNSTCTTLFVTDVDQSGAGCCQYSSENVDLTANDLLDGKANHDWIVANKTLSNYEAVETCENLNRHSQTDWYVPAVDELQLLHLNRSAIGGFGTGSYWTSTEHPSDNTLAYFVTFLDGGTNGFPKSFEINLRCVRHN